MFSVAFVELTVTTISVEASEVWTLPQSPFGLVLKSYHQALACVKFVRKFVKWVMMGGFGSWKWRVAHPLTFFNVWGASLLDQREIPAFEDESDGKEMQFWKVRTGVLLEYLLNHFEGRSCNCRRSVG